MTTVPTTVKPIARGNVELPPSAIGARVFGELADLAWPIVTNYRSDMFYDALWLHNRFLARHGLDDFPFTFLFSCREYGTAISLFEDDSDLALATDHNTNVWKCTVLQPETGRYDLAIEVVK